MCGRRALLAALVVVFGAFGANAGSERRVAHDFSRPDESLRLIRNEIATAKIPGAILLLQQHGKPVYYANFGVRDVATEISMSADTIFRLYSMSKPITSVMAMMLVEEGKLSLDDPVAKYIPAFANMKVDVEKKAEDDKVALVLEPLDRPVTIEDRDIRRPLKWESGGGGMVGTVGDYARFAQNAAEWRQL
jgi:CubicO group peptidase (beta-lactamase class C family)